MERVERKYYSDGTLQEEIHYKNGREHGPWRKWHPNGQIAEEHWFSNGVYDTGVNKTWDANGILRSEIPWVNEKRVGRTVIYDESGKPETILYSLESGIVTRAKYDKACDVRPELPRYAALPGEEGSKKRNKKQKVEAAPREDQERSEHFNQLLIDRLLRTNPPECLEWLSTNATGSSRQIGEMDNVSSHEFVARIYRIGAESVLVPESEQIPGTVDEVATQLLVRLPLEETKRKLLFAMESTHAEERGFSGITDYGQEYIYMRF